VGRIGGGDDVRRDCEVHTADNLGLSGYRVHLEDYALMPDPILTQLTTLRDYYALHLVRLELSDMDPLFKRSAMKQTREAVEELDVQIANTERSREEEIGGEALECSIDQTKRYADCHEQ